MQSVTIAIAAGAVAGSILLFQHTWARSIPPEHRTGLKRLQAKLLIATPGYVLFVLWIVFVALALIFALTG